VVTGRRYISVVTIRGRKIAYQRDNLDPLRVFAALEPVDGPDAHQANRA
jgi:hypothetical protein